MYSSWLYAARIDDLTSGAEARYSLPCVLSAVPRPATVPPSRVCPGSLLSTGAGKPTDSAKLLAELAVSNAPALLMVLPTEPSYAAAQPRVIGAEDSTQTCNGAPNCP